MTSNPSYTIGDVAAVAGSTPRTIRYYVAQGLLPAPLGTGAGAHYTDAHLARLRLIRRLQRQHLPLSEIRQRLASLGDDQIAELVSDEEPAAPPADSALDYLRTVLASRTASLTPPAPPATAPSATAPQAAALPAMAPAARPMARFMLASPGPRAAVPAPLASLAEAPALASSGPPAAADNPPADDQPPESQPRSQWDRIGLTPNIEIHVRRPLGRLENKRVDRLITIARQILKEDQP